MVISFTDVYVVYQTNKWHNLKLMLGISINKAGSIGLIKSYIKNNKFKKLSSYDLQMLDETNQTQSYNNDDIEFMIEKIILNELI